MTQWRIDYHYHVVNKHIYRCISYHYVANHLYVEATQSPLLRMSVRRVSFSADAIVNAIIIIIAYYE